MKVKTKKTGKGLKEEAVRKKYRMFLSEKEVEDVRKKINQHGRTAAFMEKCNELNDKPGAMERLVREEYGKVVGEEAPDVHPLLLRQRVAYEMLREGYVDACMEDDFDQKFTKRLEEARAMDEGAITNERGKHLLRSLMEDFDRKRKGLTDMAKKVKERKAEGKTENGGEKSAKMEERRKRKNEDSAKKKKEKEARQLLYKMAGGKMVEREEHVEYHADPKTGKKKGIKHKAYSYYQNPGEEALKTEFKRQGVRSGPEFVKLMEEGKVKK